MSSSSEFSALRGIFFPIHRFEFKKFLPMGLMMFFILFNYTILRDTKDTLIVNAAGAEALSLVKLIGTVPGAIVVLLIFSKLSNILSRENLFYVSILPFIVFFGLFAFVIYPNKDVLHPSVQMIANLSNEYPRLKTLLHVYGSWSYALFYVFSELWGSVVLSLLFWQSANFFVNITQAKRFYPLFGFLANFGLIASGWTTRHFSKIRSELSPNIDPWGLSLNYLMSAVVLGGLIIMAVYWWINRNIELPDEPSSPIKTKTKMTLLDSFKTLIRSKHLGFLALIVICYGISMNVVEAVWKGQVKVIYGNENDYNAFMGRFSMITGSVTICFMLIGSNIVRLFGWLTSAILTPIMIFITGITFFTFIAFSKELEPWTLTFFAITPTLLSIWIGLAQNVLSKSTKYSLFDPTKEMCYIPLGKEEKVKGKAAVDVVGSRVGKSGGAFIQQFFLLITGSTLVGISSYLGVIVILIVTLWIFADTKLSKSLKQLETAPKPETLAAKV